MPSMRVFREPATFLRCFLRFLDNDIDRLRRVVTMFLRNYLCRFWDFHKHHAKQLQEYPLRAFLGTNYHAGPPIAVAPMRSTPAIYQAPQHVPEKKSPSTLTQVPQFFLKNMGPRVRPGERKSNPAPVQVGMCNTPQAFTQTRPRIV